MNLSASLVGGVTGVDSRFDPVTVALAGESASALSVTLPGVLPKPSFAIDVKGTDAAGKNSSLCLQFGPATAGELSVVSALAPPSKTRKNLEIILDASGSMNTLLAGRKSRWDVALETLGQVLEGLPDDFNVGLRMYGHRESSVSPKTCTDSELVVPIRKLDRKGVMNRARAFKPKGETPLVYSALQSPADLKAVGGGTVILITDGEESCKGDPVKAAAELESLRPRHPPEHRRLRAEEPEDAEGPRRVLAVNRRALLRGRERREPGRRADAGRGREVPVHGVRRGREGRPLRGGGGGSDQLPAGDYKVVVKAGTKELVAPRVSVGLGQSVTLTIAMKNGQLVLQ